MDSLDSKRLDKILASADMKDCQQATGHIAKWDTLTISNKFDLLSCMQVKRVQAEWTQMETRNVPQ